MPKPASMSRDEYRRIVMDNLPHLKEVVKLLNEIEKCIQRPGDGSDARDPEANPLTMQYLNEICDRWNDSGALLRTLRDAMKVRGKAKVREDAEKGLKSFS